MTSECRIQNCLCIGYMSASKVRFHIYVITTVKGGLCIIYLGVGAIILGL